MIREYIKDVVIGVFAPLMVFIQDIIGYVPYMVEFVIPYMMWYLGATLYAERGTFRVGGEVLLPMVMFLLVGVLQSIANKANKGKQFPVPHKRFTTIDSDGEVSIPNERIQELILYVADVEDWLHKRGML